MKQYCITVKRNGRESDFKGTLEELIKTFSYTLEVGKSYENGKGNKKIDKNPKTIKSLIKNLYNSSNNATQNGYSGINYIYKNF